MEKEKNRVKLLISYDGSEFKGWQKQKGGTPTVQLHLEKALRSFFNTSLLSLVGASRTDTGVHALGQVAHFDAPKPLFSSLIRALNALTPPSIACLRAWKAPKDFHATFSSSKKTYKYFIYNCPSPNPFCLRYAHWEKFQLDLDYLNQMSQIMIGEKKFSSFQNQGNSLSSTRRTIYKVEWKRKEKKWVEFSITGSGFLKQMVRNIVGTQIELMRQRAPIGKLESILREEDRSSAGKTASPQGLYLFSIEYLENFQFKEIV